MEIWSLPLRSAVGLVVLRLQLMLAVLALCTVMSLLVLPAFADAGVQQAAAATEPAAGQKTEPSGDAQKAATEPVKPVEPPKVLLPDVEQIALGLSATIEALEKTLERSKDSEADLAHLRLELDGFVDGTSLSRAHFAPRLAAVKSQIDKLGPVPEKDAAPEAQQVATERQRLNTTAAELGGALHTTDLVEERARQLSDQVQSLRQQIFTSRILARSLSPLSPETWNRAIRELPAGGRQIGSIAKSWMKAASGQLGLLAALLMAVAGGYVALRSAVRRLKATKLDAPRTEAPTFFQRAAMAGWMTPLMALPAAVAALVLTLGLDQMNLLVHELEQLAPTTLSSFMIFIAVSALAKTIFSPGRAAWRLVDLAGAPAKSITRYLIWIAGFFAADRILSELARLLFLPVPVSVLVASLCSTAIALLLIRLVRTPFTRASAPAIDFGAQTAGATASQTVAVSIYDPKLLKLPLLATAFVIIGSVAFGYVSLGRFVVEQLVTTGGAIAVVLLLHLAIRAMLGAPGSGIKPIETILAERAGLSEDQGGAIASGVALVLNVVLAMFAVPMILLTWGYTLPEAVGWLKSAMFGFEIGQFKISFVRILVALGLFLAIILATRLVQRWLRSGVLESAKIDRGIANSIHTAVGYAGFTLAALMAVSYGGLDITNFAIVAGALSVGIGFGLQSIVSNFVSGLILLVERPIKVGDWVAVKGQEGFVRRIAVRSTEIETSDRASLIVPNSDLITSTVTNWTHRNALGRVVVPVTVAFEHDPEHVRAILQRVAQECTLLMQHPTPTVAFDEMDGELKFSVRAVIPDVSRSTAVQTELRTRILKALRHGGIIPHSAQDRALGNPGIVLNVAVALDNDPERVRETLEAVAQNCPMLLQPPPPTVSFDDMAGELKFSIRATIPHGSSPAAVESELRTRVLKALRNAGISLPQSTHDIYLRDLDGVKLLLARIMAERAQAATAEASPEPQPPPPAAPEPSTAAAAPAAPTAVVRPIRKDAQST